jgi:DNA-nicking Smr family endonuclease
VRVPRRLSAEEDALWRRVVESVRPLHGALAPAEPAEAKAPRPPHKPATPSAPAKKAVPGTTLDASWDRRLARGLVQPDRMLDLHGHNLATAHDRLDRMLGRSIGEGARVLLLVTGKPPADASGKRGRIRAAVGDWLAVSRHAAAIAAVRGAHPRHGGAGALYIILRRRREPT